jgi:hypothetical protein
LLKSRRQIKTRKRTGVKERRNIGAQSKTGTFAVSFDSFVQFDKIKRNREIRGTQNNQKEIEVSKK